MTANTARAAAGIAAGTGQAAMPAASLSLAVLAVISLPAFRYGRR